jgi:hypothetical protein
MLADSPEQARPAVEGEVPVDELARIPRELDTQLPVAGERA